MCGSTCHCWEGFGDVAGFFGSARRRRKDVASRTHPVGILGAGGGFCWWPVMHVIIRFITCHRERGYALRRRSAALTAIAPASRVARWGQGPASPRPAPGASRLSFAGGERWWTPLRCDICCSEKEVISMAIGRTTIRSTKSGTRVTTRQKTGNTTVTRTTGAGKKPKTTVSTRVGKTTFTKTT
jgi:hypothetical protein